MYCKAKVNNGSVVIYYSVNGIMRFPTGVTISKDKNSQNKFKEWDYKKNRVAQDVKNATKMNKTIADWITKADDVVSQYLIDGIKIESNELNKILTGLRDGNIKVKTSLFMSNFLDFYERKHVQLVERDGKSAESFKTYGTFKNTIEDFQAENNVELKIKDVLNNDWLDVFHSWLAKPRPKEIKLPNGEVYKFKSLGKLKPASIDKRFEVLTGFLSYLKEKKLIDDDAFLRNYKRTEIVVTSKIKTTLSIDEVHQLYKHKFEDKTKEKVKLVFLFSCLTGFRWKDIEEFKKEFISDFKGRKVYKHIASKTRSRTGKIATIPLSDLALEILEKLNYELKLFTNAYTNLILHDLLRETELFNDVTLSEDSETGKLHKRYELLSMHRGRDSFITNLINIVPLHELMSYTSHEKLSTLQKYIDYSRDINPEYVTIFDRNE
jgi:FMN phosphatase YigB (HAD superfamily)